MSYRGQGLPGACPVPCFSTWSSPRDASLPSFGSQRAWFPALAGTMKALRLPLAHQRSLILFTSAAHVIPLCLCSPLRPRRRRAPGGAEVPSRPRVLDAGHPQFRLTRGTPMGSLRSPGDPSRVFAPLLDPSRTDVPLPWRSHRCCPRLLSQRRLRTMRISGLAHAASAPALLRFAFRVAIHAQGWLPVGWLAFTGRVSNPLDHYERFQFTWSSPFPVLLTLLTFRTRARLSF